MDIEYNFNWQDIGEYLYNLIHKDKLKTEFFNYGLYKDELKEYFKDLQIAGYSTKEEVIDSLIGVFDWYLQGEEETWFTEDKMENYEELITLLNNMQDTKDLQYIIDLPSFLDLYFLFISEGTVGKDKNIPINENFQVKE